MSLRLRILAASTILVLVPLALLALGIRQEMSRRLSEQYDRRVETLAEVIQENLGERGRSVDTRLAILVPRIVDDNQFRLAAVAGIASERTYLLDYAGRAMGLMGLSMLQIQDSSGRILSSGHFRNEYDRREPGLPRRLAEAPDSTALTRARLATGSFLALARLERFSMAGETFSVVGGMQVDRSFLSGLARDRELAVSLLVPGDALSSDDSLAVRLAALPDSGKGASWRTVLPRDRYLVRSLSIPFVVTGSEPARLAEAQVLISYPLGPLHRLLRSLDAWLAGALAATALGTLILAVWFSAAISRPIVDLSRRTETLDLDHLDGRFESRRRDEVGTLSRFLADMMRRLRASAERLRDAERRATQGDMARQVNHDIWNGLTPLRNTFRHLRQVAREKPEGLARVFAERQESVEQSLEYLELLAHHYARLSVTGAPVTWNVNDTLDQVRAAFSGPERVTLEMKPDPELPPVQADPVAIRRILENLIRNAVESLGEAGGTVTVATGRAAGDDGGSQVQLSVSDTGPGIPAEHLDDIFNDFYTTKKSGAGLGLSIVRRLVSDLDGTVRAGNGPAGGARFTVRLPAKGGRA